MLRLLKVKSVKEGILLFLDEMKKLQFKKTVELPLDRCLGYLLAEKIVAKEDLPPYHRSTVDGYAVVSRTTTGAGESIPTILRVVEEIEMGEIPTRSIAPGEASKIPTGAMLPEGADAVVMVEDTDRVGSDLLAIYKPLHHFENINAIGEDCRKGEEFFSPGKKISPKVIAGCASLGYGKLKVYKPLRVVIVSTGDELLPPDVEIPLGKTRDINSFSIEALCQSLSMDVLEKIHVSDSKEKLRQVLQREDVDLLLVSGSSSQGDKDYLAELLEEHRPGLLFHGLGIKPGKPTILGSDGKKIIIGLPGHPVSAIVVFKAFVEEGWRRLFSAESPWGLEAKISQNIPSDAGRRKIQLVKLETVHGEQYAYPVYGASGNVSALAKADGYFVIGEEKEGVRAEEKVKVFLLD